jgi:hypothetical protein
VSGEEKKADDASKKLAHQITVRQKMRAYRNRHTLKIGAFT